MTASAPAARHYRRDIDGLRALAVLAVVGFHAFPGLLPGGFAGVDVFFVISGYLITSILLRDLDAGAFSLADFYGRRVRRIVPALLVVLIACLGFGWYALLADEYAQLGRHTAAGAGFVINAVLARETGYFDTLAGTKPLLHLWSLGIEEQFYIAWPLLVWGAWTFGRQVRRVLVGIAVLSLAMSVAGAGLGILPFYSPFTRGWELLAGAWLSLRTETPSGTNATRAQHMRSVVGLVVLLSAMALLARPATYPGAWALVPVLGTVLILAAPPDAAVNRQLAHPALVWIGLISYPLYLWHWPLLSFAAITQSALPRPSIRAAAVAVSFALAWLTARYVERPVRFGAHGRRAIPWLVATLGLVGACGAAIAMAGGVPGRSGARLIGLEGDRSHLEFHRHAAERWYRCTPEWIASEAPQWEGVLRCLQSRNDGDVDTVLLGDSHAEHLFVGLAEALPARNLAFYIQSVPPFLNHPWFGRVHGHLIGQPSIRTVILSMYWAGPINGIPEGSTLEEQVLITVRGLLDAGKTVYLTDDVPTFPFMPERCQGHRRLGPPQACSVPRADIEAQMASGMRMLRSIARREPRVRILSTYDAFCDARTCAMSRDNRLLYRDLNHLNLVGSRLMAGVILARAPELAR